MEKYIYWQDGRVFLGYLEEYPDYWTQGETIEELKENLIDIYNELTGGAHTLRASGCRVTDLTFIRKRLCYPTTT